MNVNKHFLVLFFLLLLPFSAMTVMGQDAQPVNDSPVKVTFINNSSHQITINVLSFGNIADTQALAPGANLVLNIDQGNRVRLDYEPCPKQSLLSPLGSLNELNRTVTIRNDGKNVFIQERFSGQLNKGKGQKRSKKQTISEPMADRPPNCGEKPDAQKQGMGPQDQNKPDHLHVTRKEDPKKPAPKEAVKKTSKKLKEKKKLDKKEKLEKK